MAVRLGWSDGRFSMILTCLTDLEGVYQPHSLIEVFRRLAVYICLECNHVSKRLKQLQFLLVCKFAILASLYSDHFTIS